MELVHVWAVKDARAAALKEPWADFHASSPSSAGLWWRSGPRLPGWSVSEGLMKLRLSDPTLHTWFQVQHVLWRAALSAPPRLFTRNVWAALAAGAQLTGGEHRIPNTERFWKVVVFLCFVLFRDPLKCQFGAKVYTSTCLLEPEWDLLDQRVPPGDWLPESQETSFMSYLWPKSCF